MIALGEESREEGFFGGQASRKWGLENFGGDDLKWLEFELRSALLEKVGALEYADQITGVYILLLFGPRILERSLFKIPTFRSSPQRFQAPFSGCLSPEETLFPGILPPTQSFKTVN